MQSRCLPAHRCRSATAASSSPLDTQQRRRLSGAMRSISPPNGSGYRLSGGCSGNMAPASDIGIRLLMTCLGATPRVPRMTQLRIKNCKDWGSARRQPSRAGQDNCRPPGADTSSTLGCLRLALEAWPRGARLRRRQIAVSPLTATPMVRAAESEGRVGLRFDASRRVTDEDGFRAESPGAHARSSHPRPSSLHRR